MTIQAAVAQLARSERGERTAKMLKDFLDSATVKGLDGQNSKAVATLVEAYMLGTVESERGVGDAYTVICELRRVFRIEP